MKIDFLATKTIYAFLPMLISSLLMRYATPNVPIRELKMTIGFLKPARKG